MSNPNPPNQWTSDAVELRAPGKQAPQVEGPVWGPGGPPTRLAVEFESPDLSGTPAVLTREKFLTRLAAQDEDIRVLATALRLRGYPIQTIAVGLDVPASRVRRVLKQARLDGNLHDTLADLTTEALPLAIEQLIEKLHAGEPWAIKETLRGMGAFRTYTQQDGTQVRDERKLEVTFTVPAHQTMPPMNPRGIVGAPREVVDAVSLPSATAEVSRDGDARRDQSGHGPSLGPGDGDAAGRMRSSAEPNRVPGQVP